MVVVGGWCSIVGDGWMGKRAGCILRKMDGWVVGGWVRGRGVYARRKMDR